MRPKRLTRVTRNFVFIEGARDDLLNTAVEDLQGEQLLDCKVRVEDAEVENVAKQRQRGEDLAKIQLCFINKEENEGTDDDSRVEVDGTANILDVAVLEEGGQLLTTSGVDSLFVEVFQHAALDGFDAFHNLRKELDALVRHLLRVVAQRRNEVVCVVLKRQQQRHRHIAHDDDRPELQSR